MKTETAWQIVKSLTPNLRRDTETKRITHNGKDYVITQTVIGYDSKENGRLSFCTRTQTAIYTSCNRLVKITAA